MFMGRVRLCGEPIPFAEEAQLADSIVLKQFRANDLIAFADRPEMIDEWNRALSALHR